jgi:hypothetical protein
MNIRCFAALSLGLVLGSDVALARPQRSCSENFAYCLRNCMAVTPARFAQSACAIRCQKLEHNCMATGCYHAGLCGFTRS